MDEQAFTSHVEANGCTAGGLCASVSTGEIEGRLI